MKRANIRDVAKAAGVSITTVSHALNGYSDVSEKTREHIKKIAIELNYAPDSNARALGGMTEKTIALLISDLEPKDESGFVFSIISGLYKACSESGCEFILLVTTAEKQKTHNFLQLLRIKNVDAVVVTGLREDDIYYREVLEGHLPSVLIDMDVTGERLCSVSIDNIAAAKQAVEYLINLGHCNIGMVNGKFTANVSKKRFIGYSQALLEAEIPLKLEYLTYSDFSKELAYTHTKELLKQFPEITAIFCASDVMAMGVLKAAAELAVRVPEDLSVVGFDDIPLASYVHGGLTTIAQNPYELGYIAGKKVYQLLQGEQGETNIKIPYCLKIRNTTVEVKK